MIDLVKNMSCGREKVQQRHARRLWLILQFTANLHTLIVISKEKKKTHNLLAPICQLLMLLPQGITECFANSTNKKSSIYRNTANLQEGHGGMKWKRRKRAQQE